MTSAMTPPWQTDAEASAGLRPDDRLLAFDFPGVAVGVGEYPGGPTGCTVITLPGRSRCATDIRGGSPVVLGGESGYTDAVCLTGGSSYGLESCHGVMAGLAERRAHPGAWESIPIVTGAVIYDFRRRATTLYPDKRLGYLAYRHAVEGQFPLGRRGAGRQSMVGKGISPDRGEWGGQGAAFREFSGVKVLAVTVVNALGVVVDRHGEVLRGNRDPETGQRGSIVAEMERAADWEPVRGNTTITALVTNITLTSGELTQAARMAHTAMSRAIVPFHSPVDGDVMFAVSTGELPPPGRVDATVFGAIAGETVIDAVITSVTTATPEKGTTA